jgi:maleate isomerase
VTRRIGMLTPSSNTVLEPVTAGLATPLGDRVSVHYSRFRVTVISDAEATRQQFDTQHLLNAAKLLADARPDVIVWNGTSGAWEGLDRDRELVAAIREATGVGATTATLSLVRLLRALNVRRYGLVVPYVEPIVRRIVATLGGLGFECAGTASEGLTENFSFAEIDAETLAAHGRRVAENADAIVVHCTNLRGAEVAERLSRELQRPVLDSVVVAFWGALDAVEIACALPGLGEAAKRLGRIPPEPPRW